MPGDTSNVDMRLHQALDGVQNGFGASLAYSGWGDKQSDFVIVNLNVAPRRPYDVGVLAIKGAHPYTAHATREIWFPTPPGLHGPFTMPANQILDLYEMHLDPGPCAFRLEVEDHEVDWGFSLHPADAAYITKSLVVGEGIAWQHGIGADETFAVTIPAAGYYCLAVWKTNAGSLDQEGKYRIRIEPGLTGVPDDAPPARTALTGIHPNPFNPQARIAFDLAAEGAVELAVYDLAGTRVRTLLRERRPAGRHEAVWDGRDDAGRPSASGVYMARLVSGPVRELRKMTLVR